MDPHRHFGLERQGAHRPDAQHRARTFLGDPADEDLVTLTSTQGHQAGAVARHEQVADIAARHPWNPDFPRLVLDHEEDAGGSAEFILEQAAGALDGLAPEQLSRVVIAYEPIWAIGEKGRPATVEELREPFARLGETYGSRVQGLLYGGSVNLSNARDLLGIEHVTGLFVGRTAWELDGYLELLRIGAERAAA